MENISSGVNDVSDSISIESVIEQVIYGLYHDGVFTKKILIKGGQAIRIKEGIKQRLSVDIDASVKGAIPEPGSFFVRFKKSLDKQFGKLKLIVIDFKEAKRPKNPHPDAPDFWTGWKVVFKLREKNSRNAIVPDGSGSPKITVDLSEYEYCDDFESMELRIGSTSEKTITYWYSTEMLVVEKIRAICQQHPDYSNRRTATSRARDFYDIANLVEKKTKNQEMQGFGEKCAKLVEPIFAAKKVDKKIIKRIFEPEFVAEMSKGWPMVLNTIPSADRQEFEVYVDILQDFVDSIGKTIFGRGI